MGNSTSYAVRGAGETSSPELSERHDPAHPEETRMRPACPVLSLPVTPWPKQMTGPQVQGLVEHAPAGSSAQHARGMTEGGFRRWPRGAQRANPRLCTARTGVQRGCARSGHNSCTKTSALAAWWEEGLCPHRLPGARPRGCREESTTHTAGDAQVPALGNTE